MRTTALVIALGFAALAGARGSSAGETSNLQQALDRVVATGTPGVLALVRDGDQTTRLASGYGELEQKVPMRTTDRFRVGSVTKSFVSTVVLQLVGEGKLSLDDTVEQRLPGVIRNADTITIRQLLNMTSGLPDYLTEDKTIVNSLYAGKWARTWKPRELVAIANRHKPNFAPGAGWSYSNTGYVALGLIVESVTGRPLATELRRRIFAPLHLRSTTFDTAPRISGRHTHGYAAVGNKLLDTTAVSPSSGWAAGAIVSTADDLARFYRSLFSGRLLQPEQLRSMETLVQPKRGPAGYGLGIFTVQLPCGTLWGHNGGITGYVTWAMNSKDGKRQIVVLANIDEDSLGTKGNLALEQVLAAGYCG